MKKFAKEINKEIVEYIQKIEKAEKISYKLGNDGPLIQLGNEITEKLAKLEEDFGEAYKVTKEEVWKDMMNKAKDAREEAQLRTECLEEKNIAESEAIKITESKALESARNILEVLKKTR